MVRQLLCTRKPTDTKKMCTSKSAIAVSEKKSSANSNFLYPNTREPTFQGEVFTRNFHRLAVATSRRQPFNVSNLRFFNKGHPNVVYSAQCTYQFRLCFPHFNAIHFAKIKRSCTIKHAVLSIFCIAKQMSCWYF